MAGSAVGLGNIWRFSFITGQNGGGAFLLVYLGCVFLVGIPIMLCELTMGRAAQANPVRTFHKLGPERSNLSGTIGFLALVCAISFLSFGHFFFAALFAIVGVSFITFGGVTLGVLLQQLGSVIRAAIIDAQHLIVSILLAEDEKSRLYAEGSFSQKDMDALGSYTVTDAFLRFLVSFPKAWPFADGEFESRMKREMMGE